jgi:hypothetical protein
MVGFITASSCRVTQLPSVVYPRASKLEVEPVTSCRGDCFRQLFTYPRASKSEVEDSSQSQHQHITTHSTADRAGITGAGVDVPSIKTSADVPVSLCQAEFSTINSSVSCDCSTSGEAMSSMPAVCRDVCHSNFRTALPLQRWFRL